MLIPSDHYRAIFEAAPDATLVVSQDGLILAVNPRGLELFGYPEEDLLGERVEQLVPDALRKGHARHRDDYAADPRTRPMGVGLELHARRSDGVLIPVEISLSPWWAGDELRVICSIRDIRDRLRLRRFGMSTLRATEDERERIARELHDDTAQRLSALVVWLHLADQATDPEQQRRHLAEVRDGLREAAEGVRRIARNLRPPELQDAGLSAAIQAHVRQVAHVTTARIEASIEPIDSRLDQDAQLVLYRIVQEAISNAVRHAEADTIHVRVRTGERLVVAEVADDGRGFEPDRVYDKLSGLGLIGMQERAAMIGGLLSVEASSGGGATVRIEIPMTTETPDG